MDTARRDGRATCGREPSYRLRNRMHLISGADMASSPLPDTDTPGHTPALTPGRSRDHTKTQRMWQEEGLRLQQCSCRTLRGTSTCVPSVAAAHHNQVWAIDFQNENFEDGSGFEMASILDEHTRLALDSTVDASITSEDLTGILDDPALVHGYPEVLRMDTGPELICQAIAGWADSVVALMFIAHGEPWKNGYVEAFHSRQRDEFLSTSVFNSLLRTRIELADWHHGYNRVRRQSSRGERIPVEYAASYTFTKPD